MPTSLPQSGQPTNDPTRVGQPIPATDIYAYGVRRPAQPVAPPELPGRYGWLVNQPDAADLPFGVRLAGAIRAAGFGTATAFARDLGTDPSVVIRWFKGQTTPTAEMIARIAPLIGVDQAELLSWAYPGTGPVRPVQPQHPLALELARMLAADSPLSDDERDLLEKLTDRVMDPLRKAMRRRRAV